MTTPNKESEERSARLQYLRPTVASTVARAGGIIDLVGIDQLHAHRWKQDLVDAMLGVAEALETEQALGVETEQQKEQRHGWILQAKAIEFLEAEHFSKLPEKRVWKTELALEILRARQENKAELPGITVKFREPYENYLDQFSRNSIFIFFEGQIPLYRSSASKLRIHRTVSDLFDQTHNIQEIQGLLVGAEAFNENPLLWTAAFIDELAYLLKAQADESDRIGVNINHILKRMHSLQKLINKEVVRKHIRAELLLNDAHTAFRLIVAPGGESKREFVVQIQPEEVTDDFWNMLRELHGGADIPARKACIPPPLRYKGKDRGRRDSSSYDA